MLKMIILLTRKPELSRDDFLAHWNDHHLPLARTMPGVRKLVFNAVVDPEAPYDGVSELWFDSREDLEAAYASEVGKAVAADSLAHVSARIRLQVDEQTVVG